METNQQRVSKMKYCSIILKPVLSAATYCSVRQFDIHSCVRKRDIKRIVKPSDVKINVQKVNKGLKGLKEFKKSLTAKVIFDVLPFIFYLAIVIYSAVHFSIKQKPLAYHIVCNIVSIIGVFIKSCGLAHTLYKYCKEMQQRKCKVRPMHQEHNRTITMIQVQPIQRQVIKERLSQEEPKNTRKNDKHEKLEENIIKELILDVSKEIFFIYPTIICHLYGFINEKSWEFDNSLAIAHFIIFLFTVCYDAFFTKFKYIWEIREVIIALYCNSEDNWKTKLGQCWFPSLQFMPYVFLFALLHWLILAIIGVRIYVDNFSTKIDHETISETSGYPVASYGVNLSNFSTEGNVPETGGYKVAPYTWYMIFCGFYLSVASVVVYIVLIRAWFSDKDKSTFMKIFHFLVDPIAYIVSITLMPFFIAFCVGIFLPDYDSSKFEVDANAREAATILGIIFIIIFLVCNIKATVAFVILIVATIVAVFYCMITLCVRLYMQLVSYCNEGEDDD